MRIAKIARAARTTAAFLAFAMLLGGCSGNNSAESEGTSASESAAAQPPQSSSSASVSGEETAEASSAAQPAEAERVPTVFTGPDGEVLYADEITEIASELGDVSKTAAELTKTDYGISVYCDGIQYFTEPCGVAYNNYDNAEMFDGIIYTGDAVENTNKCKRVNVGDEICGLTLVSAASEFKIMDYEDTPEPFYYCGIERNDQTGVAAVFEGTITVKGFLGVNPRNEYEPDGGTLFFTPTESKLPILGTDVGVYEHTNFVGQDYSVYSDSVSLQCGNIRDLTCSLDGVGIGDMVYAEVTLGSLSYFSSTSADASIVDIKLLSDVLYHEDDLI